VFGSIKIDSTKEILHSKSDADILLDSKGIILQHWYLGSKQ
jgi:hypothetical protein